MDTNLKLDLPQCKYKYIYRLDDDDLMAPWALSHTWDDIIAHPGYEIYRSDGHYFLKTTNLKEYLAMLIMEMSIQRNTYHELKYLKPVLEKITQ